jgi:EpsI family protein
MSGLGQSLRSYGLAAFVLLPAAVLTLRLSLSDRNPVSASALASAAIPYRIDGYDGVDRALRARTLELLETDDVVNRAYSDGQGSPPIALCLVNSPDNRKIAHPPEVCYTGWGYEVLDREPIAIPDGRGSIEAACLSVRKESTREAVLYWYRSGSAASANYYREQLKAAWAALGGKPLGTSLVRLSTPETDGRPAARERLRAFAVELLPHLHRLEEESGEHR